MREGRALDRRDLWLPGLIGLVGALTSLALWGLLVADRRERILTVTHEIADETQEAIAVGLRHQVEMLRGLGELHRVEPGPQWHEHVEPRMQSLRGLSCVEWIDLTSRTSRVVTGRTCPAPERPHDVRTALRDADRPRMLGPERDASGQPAFRILLPIETPDGGSALVAHMRVEPLLAHALRARARGHAISVFWGEEEIFARGEPSRDAGSGWWRAEVRAPLPLGGSWRVVHRPTSELAASQLTPLPHYLLAAGLVLAFALALAGHQFRVIARQARFLAASNRALEERGLQLESKVAERTEALEEAVQELQAFNFSVSHDLRSPLGAILNFTTILEEDYADRPLDAEGRAILVRIHRSATRATTLLEDLLQLSRAGRVEMQPEPIDMTELARETFAQVGAAEGADRVELHVAPLPRARGDRTLLGTVFANLFSNAIKHSRAKEKPRVHVRGHAEGGECVYEIQDNGTGFDMRFVDKIFGLFERLHSSEEVEGTGVGLALVARIVRRHGGRVWAESRPDEGATFTFTLPEGPPR